VYGTLRPKAAPAFRAARDVLSKVERYCEHMGEARTRGRLHWIDWYPGLVVSMNQRDAVFGDLIAVARPDRVFPLLDAFENASTAVSPRHDYVRRRRPVVRTNGDVVSARTYMYNRSSAVGARIGSGDFLRACAEERDRLPAGRTQ
jgi:gamma-glutamylcyclotransferase (GGCT)/AIG2-like uncharacterized protein YtfP